MEGAGFGVVGGHELGLIHIKFEMSVRHVKMSRKRLDVHVWLSLGQSYKIESHQHMEVI